MTFLIIVQVIVSLILTVIATATLNWMLHAWRTPDRFEGTGFPAEPAPPQRSFSIIVPCREEPESVIRSTVEALVAQDHPDYEIIISVGHDDMAPMNNRGMNTQDIAHELAAQHPNKVRVSVNYDTPKNKPKQLNTALTMCTKDVVGIIDAESLTHPNLLASIDAMFTEHNADVVQGAVHLVNYRATWFSLRNCLEYRTWFRSRLIGHANAGFLPLGGNTVFTRRVLIEKVGGWDGNCLAEDCDIGVRLSTLGHKIVCAYDPDLTTREEAPTAIPALIKQRTRWSLGFMQVLAKGDWKRLPTRQQRFLAWWTLVQQHAMAFAGVALPLAIVAAFLLDMPTPVVLITFLPAIPTLIMVAFEVLILHEFGKDMHFPIRTREYTTLVFSTPFYQFLLAISALRAGWKYFTGDFAWEKTAHGPATTISHGVSASQPAGEICGLLYRGYRCHLVGPHTEHVNEVGTWTTVSGSVSHKPTLTVVPDEETVA